MLVDTSGFFCLLDKGDRRHLKAESFYDAAERRLTHGYVLAELIPLCHRRGVNRNKTLLYVCDLIDNEEIEIVWVDESLHRLALAFLQSRPDKDYSLCDAVSFLLMREHSVIEALTTDHHFEQEGFRCMLGA